MGLSASSEKLTEEELRILKMISEGGLGVEAYYYKNRKTSNKQARDISDTVSVGGLGARKQNRSDTDSEGEEEKR